MAEQPAHVAEGEKFLTDLLADMTLDEKVGQLHQLNGAGGHVPESMADAIRDGDVGSILNEVDTKTLNRLQTIAREESRLGIPLLVGRDVIHGFETVLPIPLGQAASWNRDLVAEGARLAAVEAAAVGINWTFAPMLDISRDPRWGRIAESFGEDPLLTGELGAAMVRGFQGEDMTAPDSILSCVKHFVGYGASESGRDYNTTDIPEVELRNVYLPPFKAALDAGAASLMPGFSDLNGEPPSGNAWLLEQVLRQEWAFDGLVVSDWASIMQLSVHGRTENEREAAQLAAIAGVNIDMASDAYTSHLSGLVSHGEVPEARLDQLVMEVLKVKWALGLFADNADKKLTRGGNLPVTDAALNTAQAMAEQSIVLLKNEEQILPLKTDTLTSIALIGPLAHDAHEQMGTWVFDGDAERSQTLTDSLQQRLADKVELHCADGVINTRSLDTSGIDEAVEVASAADVIVLVLGEEAILSGEAHCRADIGMPGAQLELLDALQACGKPIVLVVYAGRPLVLEPVMDKVSAVLYAWHPGTMAGPALVSLLLGDVSPSGKLPVTLPRHLGQVPIYYAHKHTGKPPTPETVMHMRDIEARAPQLSVGNTSFHLDVDPSPLFAFGEGLSYVHFNYEHLQLSVKKLAMNEDLTVSVDVTNTGDMAADEIVQLYVRDPVARITRPVKELKDFQRISLVAGETKTVSFTLSSQSLGFYLAGGEYLIEPGRFQVWVGSSSISGLTREFTLLPA